MQIKAAICSRTWCNLNSMNRWMPWCQKNTSSISKGYTLYEHLSVRFWFISPAYFSRFSEAAVLKQIGRFLLYDSLLVWPINEFFEPWKGVLTFKWLWYRITMTWMTRNCLSAKCQHIVFERSKTRSGGLSTDSLPSNRQVANSSK